MSFGVLLRSLQTALSMRKTRDNEPTFVLPVESWKKASLYLWMLTYTSGGTYVCCVVIHCIACACAYKGCVGLTGKRSGLTVQTGCLLGFLRGIFWSLTGGVSYSFAQYFLDPVLIVRVLSSTFIPLNRTTFSSFCFTIVFFWASQLVEKLAGFGYYFRPLFRPGAPHLRPLVSTPLAAFHSPRV